MKKLFTRALLLMLLFGILPVQDLFSQTEDPPVFKHEIKGNALGLLIGFGEISYEYLLNDESTLGISVLARYDENYFQKFGLTGAYRYYFGKGYAKGFFGEAFGMLNTIDDYIYSDTQITYPDGSMGWNYSYEKQTITDVALGIGIGYKLVSKRGVVLEFSGGVGRNVTNNSDRDYTFVGRIGISAGYRF